MSLESLFEDRKCRKYITDGVNNANDVGRGICSVCGTEGHLLRVFENNMCECCCSSLLDVAGNYDFTFRSISDIDVVDMIREAYIVPNMTKLEADANAKFNGSIPDLMKSYGLKIHRDWNDRIKDGWIWIVPGDMTSGSTHINKFLNDYECVPVRSKGLDKLVPDSDGTFYSVASKVSVPGVTSKKATTKAPTKQSSSNLVSTGFDGYVLGNDDSFTIQLGDNEELNIVKTAEGSGTRTYEISYSGNKIALTVSESDCKDLKKAVSYFIKKVSENPGIIFPAFEEQGSVKEFSISKYPFYTFVLDENSFGKKLSLAIVYQGKVFGGSNRVVVSGKALSSKMLMSAELTKATDEKIAKQMPGYVASPKFKTSMGVATFELKDMNNGVAEFNIDLANQKFTGRIDKNRFSNVNDTKDAYTEILVNAFVQGLIPEFNEYGTKSITGDLTYHISFSDGTYHEQDGKGVDVYADFDWDELSGVGDISFNVSIIDEFSGIEQPKQKRKFVYRKAGVRLKDFLKKCGKDLYDEFFKKSDMQSQMRDSAREKMKSPSKKVSLLKKIADKLVDKIATSSVGNYIKNFEVELDMKVNSDGKVTSATITVMDPYRDEANNSAELKDKLKLESTLKWLTFSKIDKAEKNGPTVIYNVSKINDFADYIDLQVFENAILEAFNIVQITESGRKMFHV